MYVGGRKRAMKRGIPNVVMNLDNRTRKIDSQLLPSPSVAAQQYRMNGGTISEPCSFGYDPLEGNSDKKNIRFEAFCSRYSFHTLFCEVSNGCEDNFKNALKYFIDITYRLAHS